jgi:hypothetical protein
VRLPALFLAGLLLAAPAEAQFRLPKPKVPTPSLPGASAPNVRMPTYDDRVLEMTDARLTGLMRGFKAATDARPALERGYKKNADDRAAQEVAIRRQGEVTTRWNNCLMQAMGIDTVAQRRLDERMQAARDRNDNRTVQRLEDSVANAMMTKGPEMAMAQAKAIEPGGKCGPMPRVNQAVTQPTLIPEPRIPLGDSLRVVSSGAAGMTAEQFAVMQERVLAFLTTPSHNLGSSAYAYSPNELRVLQAKRSELARYQGEMTEQ